MVSLFAMSVVFFFTSHGQLVLLINQHRFPLGDALMPYLTYLGDGVFYGLVCLLLLIRKWRTGLLFVLAGISQSIVSAILKRLVFPDVPRPKKYFEGIEDLSFIEGVRIATRFSFPSGHTMTAFLLATLLSLVVVKDRKYQALLLAGALVAGFSRMYLLQHFYRDVVAGSLIGVLMALAFFVWVNPLILRDRPGNDLK